jgi:hypothetical protein
MERPTLPELRTVMVEVTVWARTDECAVHYLEDLFVTPNVLPRAIKHIRVADRKGARERQPRSLDGE